MIEVIRHEILPVRFQQNNLGLVAMPTTEVPESFLDQIFAKSLQPHVMEFEGHEDIGTTNHPGRFRDKGSYQAWASGKERIMYILTNGALRSLGEDEEEQAASLADGAEGVDVGGVIWYGQRENEHAPGRDITFGIRLYGEDEAHESWEQYRGVGLGSPFMQATHTDLATRPPYIDKKLWLSLVSDNDAAHALYGKNGYVDLVTVPDDEHDGRNITYMANDTALLSGEAA